MPWGGPSEASGIKGIKFMSPQNIDYVGAFAFFGNMITEVELPNTTAIGRDAFYGNCIEKLELPSATNIGENAFQSNNLDKVELQSATNISKQAFANNNITDVILPSAITIGERAFNTNNIKELKLPKAVTLDERAFSVNSIENLELPKIKTIGESAFLYSKLKTLNLPQIDSIGSGAFKYNSLMEIHLDPDTTVHTEAFKDQRISHEIKPNEQGEIQFDDLSPKFFEGTDDEHSVLTKILFDEGSDSYPVNNITLHADNTKKKITGATNTSRISLFINTELNNGNSLPGDYSIERYSLTINPFKESTDGNNNVDGNENNTDNGNTDNSTQPDNNNSNNNGNSNQTKPKPEEKRPHTVYAKRGMRLHRNVSLTSPIRSYKKQSRAKAASFRVRGIAYDNNGKKRYKVDGGYITAGSSYVADSHFRSNKVRQVRVLSNRVNSYKDVKLSSNKKVRSYKKGTKLRVKRVVNWGRATRFELTNGRYITGNKQLLIMDQK
ncbi:hypothetical protein IWT30_00160 [Secundilactobacillus mixtipabuli]|uniref:DUF5776 domain-containing protein n=2 Tax=Secundilactobacillus mixtipabuli TaxID=1435342 RepID=A0A1Z5I9B6_9LACO|nr:hypothetical protein IWT30_00160 [Secundilactobacillus mixtipabuli]